MSDKESFQGELGNTTGLGDGDMGNDLPDIADLSIHALSDKDHINAESKLKTECGTDSAEGSSRVISDEKQKDFPGKCAQDSVKNDKIRSKVATPILLGNKDKASSSPATDVSSMDQAHDNDPVSCSDIEINMPTELTVERKALSEPSNEDTGADSDAEESDIDSNAEDSDVDSDDSNVFDDAAFDYDSEGEAVEYYRPPPPEAPQVPPLERFLNSLSEIPAEDITNMDKCHVCKGAYKVLGVLAEIPVRLMCTHVVGKECLGAWMGPVDEGGWGSRKCPVCNGKIVVPGEEESGQ